MGGKILRRSDDCCWWCIFWMAIDWNMLRLKTKLFCLYGATKEWALMKLHHSWCMQCKNDSPTENILFWLNQKTCGPLDQMHKKLGWSVEKYVLLLSDCFVKTFNKIASNFFYLPSYFLYVLSSALGLCIVARQFLYL
jgi:hypothetical protein